MSTASRVPGAWSSTGTYAIAIGWPRVGRERPAGHLADRLAGRRVDDGVAGPRRAAAGRHEPDQRLLGALVAAFDECLVAHEPALLVEVHDPAESGLERRDAAAQLLAVQGHAGLEPQRVPAGQPGRDESVLRPASARAAHDGGRIGRAAVDLEPVLAGVAGPGQQHGYPGEGALVDRVVLQLRYLEVGELRDDRGSGGSLDGDQRPVLRGVPQLGVEALDPLPEGVEDGGHVAGVGDDQEPLLGEPVDDQVVEDAAALVAQHRVPRPADSDPRWSPDERVVEGGAGLGAGQLDLAHVAEVEQSGGRTDGGVLGELGGVADRHRPAGEVGEAARRAPRGSRCSGVGLDMVLLSSRRRWEAGRSRRGCGRRTPARRGRRAASTCRA